MNFIIRAKQKIDVDEQGHLESFQFSGPCRVYTCACYFIYSLGFLHPMAKSSMFLESCNISRY